jgi:hypothetical protein
MRRELLVTLVGSALALVVYAGATTTDARVGTLASVVQAALETHAPTEWSDIFYSIRSGAFDYLVFFAFLLLFFGLNTSGDRPGSLFVDRSPSG